MAGPGPIVADLRAECDDLDALVAPLPPERWADPTPALGWTIAHQIAHLLWTDEVSLTAVTDEAGFAELLKAAQANPEGFVDAAAEELAILPPADLLTDWRVTRGRLHEALVRVPDGRKLPWFGPPMSATSMATARLMETWAHGLDIADAVGVTRPATDRLRSIAHLGVRTRDYAFVDQQSGPADRTVPGRAAWTRRRHVVLGTDGRRAAGHGLGRGLLRAGYPTASTQRSRHHGRRPRCAALAADCSSLRGPARPRSMSAEGAKRAGAIPPSPGR